jgi:2-polyprenyl-3-methyl-5-hydroxy-6-metoxy-1,4-benzoquinol methylase
MHEASRKTTVEYWDEAWEAGIRMKLPSGLDVGVLNLMRLLRRHAQPGMSVLEIGFAPGKLLSWTASILRTKVSGLDYSSTGIRTAKELFKRLGLDGDLRCEDVFNTTFKSGSFDLVCSFGLIEHFDDPREIVRRHVHLAKPGGVILIVVPSYGGVYGRLQHFFDRHNLGLHNLNIMTTEAMANLAPIDAVTEVEAFKYGRLSPWLISFDKRWSRFVARSVSIILNAIGLVQPFDIAPVCPLIVLKMVKLPH